MTLPSSVSVTEAQAMTAKFRAAIATVPEVESVISKSGRPEDGTDPKNVNNIEQVKARKGPIIAVTSGNGAKQLKDLAADIIEVPDVIDCLSPVLTVIPLQLLAYHLAVELGRDVDKPRNLAKSVTVE